MGPPGGGRQTISQRYLRHYTKIYIEPFGKNSLKHIFSTMVDWFFNRQQSPFTREISGIKEHLVSSTIEIFSKISTDLLPTPAKTHYLYNLRDISKVFQGISQTSSKVVT